MSQFLQDDHAKAIAIPQAFSKNSRANISVNKILTCIV